MLVSFIADGKTSLELTETMPSGKKHARHSLRTDAGNADNIPSPRRTRQQILNDRFPSGVRIDISRRDWRNLTLVIISWLLYVASAFMVSYAVQSMILTDNIQKSTARTVIDGTKSWPTPDIKAEYDAAKEYNDGLSASGMRAMGDAVDPSDGKRLEEKDEAYQKALNINHSGAMAVLRIPKISSEMTVYHGTTDDVLTAGVGHIYGSALPIGEKGTTAAVSAHSGGVNGLFFTRLLELRKGDYMYLNVLGDEQGYEIEDIITVKPERLGNVINEYAEKSKKDNESRLFASTCTPPGVNTERLIVIGVRKSIPHPIPRSETQKDNHLFAATVALIMFVAFIVAAIIFRLIRRHVRIERELARLDAETGRDGGDDPSSD